MTRSAITTGVPELDGLVGGLRPGDNVVWEANSGAILEKFVSRFVTACADQGATLVYASFNRSPQAVVDLYGGAIPAGRFVLVDCFSSGKGNEDPVFLEFFKSAAGMEMHGPLHVQKPSSPAEFEQALIEIGSRDDAPMRYVFDSLTGMFDLWGDEDQVLCFFGHFCPRLHDLGTVAYWLVEKEAHSKAFLARVRHITQVVLDVAAARGGPALTVRKAFGRPCADIGVPMRFSAEGDKLVIAAESREGRELELLSRMGKVFGSALDPAAFFEQTMTVMAEELGLTRGTLVLLDPVSGKLRIAAAHGLSPEERARGEYAVGEGVTGRVVETGQVEVVPDIGKDPRFLDRTGARRKDLSGPIAFICVPVAVDGEVMGALSADRPFAGEATLQKDVRLLLIVASMVSQVLKLNRIMQIEKEKVLAGRRATASELRKRYRLDNVVGESKAIRDCLAVAATAAKSRASILITGETGTGKELVANVIHYNSPRAEGPFVKVNCGALPETLLESELFGHVKGAFTGAVKDRRGRVALADGGTLFLDEVAEMSPRLQVKLLRVLQEREFEPVGSELTVRSDVRLVAATSKDLKEEVACGRFREDLYYRLNVIAIHLPPLRERREDIPILVDHFLERYNRLNEKKVTRISREVLDLLVRYPWPGNVRELENCIERAVVMSDSDSLAPELLPEEITSYRPGAQAGFRGPARVRSAGPLGRAIREFIDTRDDLEAAWREATRIVEETVLRRALEVPSLSQRELARKLGLSRVTLRKRLREYGLG